MGYFLLLFLALYILFMFQIFNCEKLRTKHRNIDLTLDGDLPELACPDIDLEFLILCIKSQNGVQ